MDELAIRHETRSEDTTMMTTVITGNCVDVLKTMQDNSVHCCVTSPPYWGHKDYGIENQLGIERSPDEYISKVVEVFREVHRVLRADGTLWLILGDSHIDSALLNGMRKARIANEDGHIGLRLKLKDVAGIPWRVAFALQADGWWLRQDIIWHKTDAFPESVCDRCTNAHEYVFMLAKSQRYFYDAKALKEPCVSKERQRSKSVCVKADSGKIVKHIGKCGVKAFRNRRSVWSMAANNYECAHPGGMPVDLAEMCILAGTSGLGCCPSCGAPWTRTHVKRSDDTTSTADVEWAPACTCGGDPVPCTVLDPFGGSGTTAVAAARNWRQSVIIELNPEHAKLASSRMMTELISEKGG